MCMKNQPIREKVNTFALKSERIIQSLASLSVNRGIDLGRDLLGCLGRGVRRVRGGVLGLAGVVSSDVEGLGGGLGGLGSCCWRGEGLKGFGEKEKRGEFFFGFFLFAAARKLKKKENIQNSFVRSFVLFSPLRTRPRRAPWPVELEEDGEERKRKKEGAVSEK